MPVPWSHFTCASYLLSHESLLGSWRMEIKGLNHTVQHIKIKISKACYVFLFFHSVLMHYITWTIIWLAQNFSIWVSISRRWWLNNIGLALPLSQSICKVIFIKGFHYNFLQRGMFWSIFIKIFFINKTQIITFF